MLEKYLEYLYVTGQLDDEDKEEANDEELEEQEESKGKSR